MEQNTAYRNFAKISLLEGISFLILLGIAMPLKYFFDQPLAVKIVGMLHGVLFIAYAFQLLFLLLKQQLPFKTSLLYFIAAFLPFAPFVVEKHVKRNFI